MTYIHRSIETQLQQALSKGKSVLLLGPRQAGKTTLLKHQHTEDLYYTLLDTSLRIRLEKSPELLRQEIIAHTRIKKLKRQPIVVIDEVQKVPELMDVIQLLIDSKEAQFVLTGSSMRKLKRHAQINLLPGRLINIYCDPLSLLEIPKPLPPIEELLTYGSLPGIYEEADKAIKEKILISYVNNYLEEEVRGEALVRQLGTFVRFLEFAAIENGHQININKLSQELGIGRHTITQYYEVLEDCLITHRVDPLTKTTSRRRLTKAPKYLLFDMGIRRILTNEGVRLSATVFGELFEQFIGLELLRYQHLFDLSSKLYYWRDHAGPEVDYVLERNRKYLPIEVKWSETPTLHDANHLIKFMHEYHCIKPAYIVCQSAKPFLLSNDVMAISWRELPNAITQSLENSDKNYLE